MIKEVFNTNNLKSNLKTPIFKNKIQNCIMTTVEYKVHRWLCSTRQVFKNSIEGAVYKVNNAVFLLVRINS